MTLYLTNIGRSYDRNFGQNCQCGINCLEILSLFRLKKDVSKICSNSDFLYQQDLHSVWNSALSKIFNRDSEFARSKKKLFHPLQYLKIAILHVLAYFLAVIGLFKSLICAYHYFSEIQKAYNWLPWIFPSLFQHYYC